MVLGAMHADPREGMNVGALRSVGLGTAISVDVALMADTEPGSFSAHEVALRGEPIVYAGERGACLS